MFSSFIYFFRTACVTKSAITNTMLENGISSRTLHITSVFNKVKSISSLREHRNLKDPKEKTLNKQNEYIDNYSYESIENFFPDENTPNLSFDGIPFQYLHTFNIKACKNNTIISVTDYSGKVILLKSCGTEGYKTCKKGTNVAAQATAFAISKEAFERGIRTARVRVQGLGPGRLSAIKGIQTGGTNIISLTDNTHVSWDPPRPRKQRRV